MKFMLNLQRFTETGPAEAAPVSEGAETATAAESAPADPVITAGSTLPDGTKVQSAQVAAALQKQMRRHPELRGVYGQARQQEQPAAAEESAEKTIQERWEEVKKGEFAELYGQDVQSAIRDRFKNQADVSAQLNALEPMLKVLRDRAGVESNEALIHHVMDDDSLYEEAASEAGMTVAAYRQFMELKAQRDEMEKREQESIHDQRMRQHYGKLQQQAEDLKQKYPEFDLQKELGNKEFFRLTSPDVGISVEDAYFAIHHRELAPQMMAYGMERAKQQMGQTIQAQRSRPAEGAMRAQGQGPAELKIDPRNMTKAERAEIKRQVRLGRRVSFD